MSKNIIRFLLCIIGMVLVSLTVLVFFILDFDKSISNYVSLGFVVFAEVVCFLIGFISSKLNNVTNKLFLNVGISSILFIYLIASYILMFVSGLFKDSVSLLVAIEILLIAIVVIILILISVSTSKIDVFEQQIIEDRKLMEICEKRIYDLLVDKNNKLFKNDINSLYEMFKYGDKIGVTTVDEKIVGAILNLERSLKTSAINMQQFERIKELIFMRNMELSEIKRGKF